MREYLFILGRDHELSILELTAYFQKNDTAYSIKEFSKTAAIILTDEKFNPKKAIKRLGGIVKIGEPVNSITEVYQGTKNKIKYAISVYGKTNIKNLQKEIKKKIEGTEIKRVLQKT